MRRYYILFGTLLIVPIALAAPVLVQEKRQAGVDVVHIPEGATTTLGKRVTDLNEMWLKYLDHFENHFPKPEEGESAARPSSSSPPSEPDHEWTEVEQPPPSIPKRPPPVSSPPPPTESEYEMVGEEDAPPGPSRLAAPSTESDHGSAAEVHAPLSNPVFPAWFLPDHGSMEAHAPQPNLGPSNPTPSAEFDSNHWLVVEEPPSRPASPIESDHEMVDVSPPSSGH